MKTIPIITRLGGLDQVKAILEAATPKVRCGSTTTIAMWLQPNRGIPGKAMRALMRHCETNHVAYCVNDFEVQELKEDQGGG